MTRDHPRHATAALTGIWASGLASVVAVAFAIPYPRTRPVLAAAACVAFAVLAGCVAYLRRSR